MLFKETKLKDVYVIEPEEIKDYRGFFSRVFCKREFESKGLVSNFVQSNISFNLKKNTIRGMHYQVAPFEEVKLVRCTQGAINDVIIDIRPWSPSYKQWISVVLTRSNYKMLYVPMGFAHGYQTLEDNTEVFYFVSQIYSPDYERGIRWNNPLFGIKWIEIDSEMIISEKDKSWPDFSSGENG